MRFEKDFPDKLRSQILVSEVVGKKVKLKLRGKEFMGLCPFHNEKSPSFTVNDLKGFYHCFGCQAHGDVITFVMQSEGLDFADAVKKLADDHSIAIPLVKNIDYAKEAEKATKIDREYLLLEKIAEFFEKNLQESQGVAARNYAAKRGLSLNINKKFRLGFAPNSYDALYKFLSAQGFQDPEILACGLVAKNEQQKIYSKFRNRLIFPITDKKNRVIAFGGRALEPQDMPKYLNSAETEIFKKNQTLYNIFYARKPIFEKKFAVVVEGYMDVISLVANGVENVVAALGTAFGENHLRELFLATNQVVICLDGDEAGIRAAKRAAEIALPIINSSKNISFTFLPNQMDPDDFVKNFGANKLEESFANSVKLSQALIEFALRDLNLNNKSEISAEDKAKIESELTKKIALIKDSTTKKYFTQHCKEALFYLGRKPFKKDKNAKNEPKKFGNLAKNNYTKPNDEAQNLAKNIVALMIKFPQLAHHQDENFDIKEVNFLSEKFTEIKDFVVEFVENNSEINESNLLLALENQGFEAEIKEIKNLLANIPTNALEYANSGFEQISQKMSLLLLKELLLQVDLQYKSSLKSDEIATNQTQTIDEKITEIFAYKNSLEQKILNLENDLI